MFVLGFVVSGTVVSAQESNSSGNIVINLPTFDNDIETDNSTLTAESTSVTSGALRGRIGCNVRRIRSAGSAVIGKTKGVVSSTRSTVRSGVTRVVSRGRSVSSRSVGVASNVLSRGRGRVRRVLSRVRGVFRR